MKLINLTPHRLDVKDENGTWTTLSTSGQVARVTTQSTPAEPVDAEFPAVTVPISTWIVEYGEVEGLPDPEPGVGYVVSGLVLSALGGSRPDVFAPGDLIRDSSGRPIGCHGLKRG